MTFRELRETINMMTEEQQDQEVYFLEPCDEPSAFSCSLSFVEENEGPIYDQTHGLDVQTVVVEKGMPFLC